MIKINVDHLNWRLSFFLRILSVRQMLIPFGTVNRTFDTPYGRISYTDVYIFCFRVARIQL
jgi:hypothetical protein